MKKFLALILTAMLSLSLVACGGDDTSSTKTSSKNNSSSSQDKGNSDSTPAGNDDAGGTTAENNDSGNDNAGGEVAQNEWPSNEFTALVTKPEFTVSAVKVESSSGEGKCSITFTGVSVEQAKAYAQTLQNDGFKYSVEDEEDMTGAYTFRAWNVESGDGYMVVLQPDVFGNAGDTKLIISTGTAG
jgi:hypothetical protein